MTVREVMDMARFGELRNLKLGQYETEAIVSYINLGLLELYKRFPLSIKEELIELLDSTNAEYTLPTDFMWLVAAFGEVPENQTNFLTYELSINDENDPYSVNTVGWNKVQIPSSIQGDFVSLIYAAAPDTDSRIVLDEAGAYLDKDIALPPQLIEPLLFYIGYRAHGAMDGNIQSESNTHYMRFDKSCQKIKTDGMFTNDDMNMRYRVSERGFV
jgi:hypothetical protein